jgi:hypothetical protein
MIQPFPEVIVAVLPSLLPYGKSDESALALAALATRVGRLFDATVPDAPAPAPAAVKWTVTRGDYRDPILHWVDVGRVELTAEYALQDGVGGPRDVFVRFQADVRGLTEGRQVLLTWNGGTRLEATLKGPAGLEARARALLEGAHVTFVASE